MAEKLRQLIDAHDFAIADINISVSLGVTVYRKNEQLEQSIKRADMALYKAKQNGRNNTVAE